MLGQTYEYTRVFREKDHLHEWINYILTLVKINNKLSC